LTCGPLGGDDGHNCECCVPAGSGTSDDSAPEVDPIDPENYPQFGMRTKELRALKVVGRDNDKAFLECGIDINKCPQPIVTRDIPGAVGYTWEVLEGAACVTFEDDMGPVAVIRSTETTGRVRIKVTIDDGSETPAEIEFPAFYVFDFRFVNQSGDLLPNIYYDTTGAGNEGLMICRRNPGQGIDVPGNDNEAYHAAIHGIDLPPATTSKIRLRVRRPTPSATEYESTGAFNQNYDAAPTGPVVPGQDLTIATNHEFRLVSNPRPVPSAPLPPQPTLTYDDELLVGPPDQTAFVRVGDWVEASLENAGVRWCSIDLPVERPWTESNQFRTVYPDTILETTLHWYVVKPAKNGSISPHPSMSGWAAATRYETRRTNALLAQAGIVCVPEIAMGAWEINNSMLLLASPWPSNTAGTLRAIVNSVTVDVALFANETVQTVSSKLCAAITATTGLPASNFNNQDPDQPQFTGRVVLVNQGVDDVLLQVPLYAPPLSPVQLNLGIATKWGDNKMTNTEANVLGLNFGGPHPGSSLDRCVAYIVRDSMLPWDGDPTTLGWTYPDYNPTSDFWLPGIDARVILRREFADGCDEQFQRVPAHELSHWLGILQEEPNDPENLMFGAVEMYSPDLGRRLGNPGKEPQREDVRKKEFQLRSNAVRVVGRKIPDWK